MKTRRVDFEPKRQRPLSTPQKDQKSCSRVEFMKKRVKMGSDVSCLSKTTKYQRIPFIPEIRLSVREMKGDPMNMLIKLQAKYAKYGGVKLLTPAEWNPSFSFKSTQMYVTTRVQRLWQLKLGKPFEEKKDAYSLQEFGIRAINFQKKYKYKFQECKQSSQNQLENQYWGLVRGASTQEQQKFPKKYKVTVEYAADLPVSRYGSGFPRLSCAKNSDSNFNYAESLFNLNNLYRSECSLLRISDLKSEYIGGITIPWVYVGMMFSSFCWHVQDCNINSINYNHHGAVKIWYLIPEEDKEKVDRFVLQKYNGKNILGKITVMIDPLELMDAGIRVLKTYQHPGQYVCTFFKAYHCGFSGGFNVGEAVNYVTAGGLQHIKRTIFNQPSKGTLFCYEWLVYENHMSGLKQVVSCDVTQVAKEYWQLLIRQERQLDQIVNSMKISRVQLVQERVKYDRWCCSKCKRYVFLSFVQCQNCKKCFCLGQVQNCCEGQMIIMSRVPNMDRQRYINHLQRSIKND